MEKRLRSSLQNSAEEFLSAAAKLAFKSSRNAIKSLINDFADPSSDLTSTLTFSLRNSISHSISQFKNFANPSFTASPATPPAKRVRRSGRNKKNDVVSPTNHRENERQSVSEKLQVYVYVLRLCIFHPKNVFCASDLLPAVQELHDNLILFESDTVLLSGIANLCEEWWKGDLLGKETLISQSLPVILSRSLTLKKKVDVHRVYMLRDAFMLFDFEDESIEDLKHLLIRCAISPLYLQMEDGRKFIAFTFGLSVQLAKEVFAMIKSQIPFGRKSLLEAYGEILFRAWKAVEAGCKDEIENGFLQGLVEGAIYASSETFAASIRRVLGGFINNRTTEGVEKLIFRLAEPVIFRSLQVANSNVRHNALHLLLDLFPLEDPDSTKEAKDTLLEKQFFLFEKLLMDECPEVRVVAVEGSCRILHMFWEVIPSTTITKIITRIFDHMTHDACSEVRLSTVNGVIYLIGNPQSHEVLKVLLPRLGNLISDPASVVRAAVIDLLLRLNDIRNFHFHKVVHVDTLFSTLATDQPLIAKKITRLLIPSYFPSKVTTEEASKRCVTLIKRSPLAGARFCEFAASEGASLGSLMELFKVLIASTISSTNLDEQQIEGMFLSASNLCSNLVKDASSLKALKEELSGENLKILFSVASTGRARSSLCRIISTTAPENVDDLFEECMSLITKCSGLSDNVERQDEVRSAHKMIFSCGWFDNMFEIMVGLLQNAANGCHVKFGTESGTQDASLVKRRTKSSIKISAKSRSGSRRKSSKNDRNEFFKDYAIATGIAWQIKELLQSESTRDAVLDSRILESAYLALKVISEASILHVLQNNYLNKSPISAYTTLALHMSLHSIEIDGGKDPTQASITQLTLDHLLHCTLELFRANESRSFLSESLNTRNMESDCSTDVGGFQTGASFTSEIRMSNMMKMLTAILKFVVDATVINLVPQYPETCLNFMAKTLKFVNTKIRQLSIAQIQFIEVELKDIFYCLKSSFTYAAKLLNKVLKDCEVTIHEAGPYALVNELFALFISVEEFLGYGYAARFIAVVQPWLPDMILALGSYCLLNVPKDSVNSNSSKSATAFLTQSWFYTLARVEIHELSDMTSDEEMESARHALNFPVLKRLLKTMSQLLKRNITVLDAVGETFLAAAQNALQERDFGVVFGLLHFVCAKLVGNEDGRWKELKWMLGSLETVYADIEKEAEDLGDCEDDRSKLYRAKALLEPIWTAFVHEREMNTTEEE